MRLDSFLFFSSEEPDGFSAMPRTVSSRLAKTRRRRPVPAIAAVLFMLGKDGTHASIVSLRAAPRGKESAKRRLRAHTRVEYEASL